MLSALTLLAACAGGVDELKTGAAPLARTEQAPIAVAASAEPTATPPESPTPPPTPPAPPAPRPADAIDVVASPRPEGLKIDGKLDEWNGLIVQSSLPARGAPVLAREAHESQQRTLVGDRKRANFEEQEAAKKEKREAKLLPEIERVPYAEPPELPAKSTVRLSATKQSWVFSGSIAKAAGEEIVIALESPGPRLPDRALWTTAFIAEARCDERPPALIPRCEAAEAKNPAFLEALAKKFRLALVLGSKGAQLIDETGGPLGAPKQAIPFAAVVTGSGLEFELELPLTLLPMTTRASEEHVVVGVAPRSALTTKQRHLDALTATRYPGAESAFPESTLPPDRWRAVPVSPALVYDPLVPKVFEELATLPAEPGEFYYAPSNPKTVFTVERDADRALKERASPLAVKLSQVGPLELWRYAGALFSIVAPQVVLSLPVERSATLVAHIKQREAELVVFESRRYDEGLERTTATYLAFRLDKQGNVDQIHIEEPSSPSGYFAGCEARPGSGQGGVILRTCYLTGIGPNGMPQLRAMTFRNGFDSKEDAFLLLDGKSQRGGR